MRLLQLLDIGGDMDALDIREPRHALGVKPVAEVQRRARIGAARVRVADVGSEEFEEAIGGARRRRRSAPVHGFGYGDELVHSRSMTLFQLIS
jgi:hypothetical protein